MEVWCVRLGEGEGGWRAGRRDARVGGGSSPLLSACVGECCCAPGGGGSLFLPSAPVNNASRRVFYGSCWTLISFVARLSRAAAALSPPAPPPLPSCPALPSPQKACAFPPPSRKKKKPRTTRYCGLTGDRNRLPHYPPRGQVCNKSIWKKNKN